MHGSRTHSTYLSIVAAIIWMVALSLPAQAQTFTVLHTFTGAADGATPFANLVLDQRGNLYGNTAYGGIQNCPNGEVSNSCGVVFKLAHRQNGWLFSPLYAFGGGTDGASPVGNVTIASDGTIYGTTNAGGGPGCADHLGPGCGTVFRLQPPPTNCVSSLCPWRETVLHRFTGGFADTSDPFGGVVLDSAGDVFGTGHFGGSADYGAVFELTPSGSGWTESLLHSFQGGPDGAYPVTGFTWDESGNLTGTATNGGNLGGDCGRLGCGVIFQMRRTGSGWSEYVIYGFENDGDGAGPSAPLVLSPEGYFYSIADGETIYELTPSGGNWNYSVLYSFGLGTVSFSGPLAQDSDGSFYGTSVMGGINNCSVNGCGFVYKLARSGNNWVFHLVYEFTGGADGYFPYGGVVMDSNGNLYGTASMGGSENYPRGSGTVWEITP